MLATVNSGQRSDAPYNAHAAAWASSGEQLVSAGRDLQNGCEALLSSAVEHTNFMLRVSLSVLAANAFTWLALGWIALYERRGRYFGGPSEGGFRSWTLAQLDAGLRSARGHVLHYRIFGGWAMMAVAALAVIMTGLFAVHGMDVLTSEHEWAMHSHQAPADSGALRLHVAEAETATRAYTIPRDRLQVTAEQAGMQASRKTWKKLSEETADNTQQQRKLREVFGFVNMRLASMLRVNDAVRSGGLHAVRALVANSRMSSLKCSLERSIGNFDSAAHRSLMEQSLQERHQATASKALLGFVLLPASLGLGFMGALTTQMLRRNTEPQLAHQDWPTALPHRLQSKARFDDVLDRADKNNGTFAVLGMDLDHFKQGNDRWGQETGDQYLRTVVARLGSALRATDTLLRIGGDEFLCLLDALRSQRDATLVAQKLLASFEQPLVFRKGTLRASASIGTASYPVNGSNADELQRKADAVLYEAKVAARGRAGFSAEVRSTGEQVHPALLHAGVLSTAQGAIAPHSL